MGAGPQYASEVDFLASELESSVFRAFERSEFLDWPAWNRLRRILTCNGGSYGLAGPRGAGKSWLMLRAIEEVRGRDVDGRFGLGLWYPSPSEYSPTAFLASLSDSLATEIERRYGRRGTLLAFGPLWGGVAAVTGLALLASLVLVLGLGWWLAATAGVLVGIAIGVYTLLRVRALRPEEQLLREAAVVRERARYSATQRESSKLGAEGGRGLVARVKASRERELVERPATLSTLVNDFRSLAQRAGEVAGRVLIAIDELDKMADPAAVRELLRDIKGIFEVPRVHFLVSVSDEAARTLNLARSPAGTSSTARSTPCSSCRRRRPRPAPSYCSVGAGSPQTWRSRWR
jgi:KAP family P-loop domain